MLVGATVAITGGYVLGEDVLAFTDQTGITGTFDSDHGVLTLNGNDTVGNYQAALQSVTFFDAAGEFPTPGTRIVTFTIDDGTANGNPASDTRDITSRRSTTPRRSACQGRRR